MTRRAALHKLATSDRTSVVDPLSRRASDARVTELASEDFPFWFENAQNGQNAWAEKSLMDLLGYRTRQSFRKIVQRAMHAWVSAGNDPGRDFILLPNGEYKFTRSACFLIAMNGDPKKKTQVANAQAYFVRIANIVQSTLSQAEAIDRLVIRDELTEGMKSLASTAQGHGVTNYGRFNDEGYRGMYNLSLEELTKKKGVPLSEKLLDRMDRAELAANLFRVTQTDERIRRENVQGQTPLELAAREVGAIVRETMIKTSGVAPEELAIAPHISDVKRELRGTGKTLQTFDRLPKRERVIGTLPLEVEEPTDPGYTTDPEEPEDDE